MDREVAPTKYGNPHLREALEDLLKKYAAAVRRTKG
jgi:hypothetical protein